MKVGDLVRFQDPTGEFPGASGELALIVRRDRWATIIEWLWNGEREDIENYMVRDPANTYLDDWLEVISGSKL